jgi:hypothetical protein
LDAQAVLTHVVALALPSGWIPTPNGDANCDGQVTSLDALIILRFAVGLDTAQFCVGTFR